MTTNHERSARLAVQLYDARNAARLILGDKYRERMHELGEAIRLVAVGKGISELSAVTEMAQHCGPFQALQLLAAFVERVEPSAASA